MIDTVGEYSFCFSNAMSTFAHKVVNFDISLSGEAKAVTKTAGSSAQSNIAPIQASVDAIRDGLVKVERTLNYYRTREKVCAPRFCSRTARPLPLVYSPQALLQRNFDTVYQTEARVFWTTTIECALIVGMAALQVFVVRSFFSTGSKRQRA